MCDVCLGIALDLWLLIFSKRERETRSTSLYWTKLFRALCFIRRFCLRFLFQTRLTRLRENKRERFKGVKKTKTVENLKRFFSIFSIFFLTFCARCGMFIIILRIRSTRQKVLRFGLREIFEAR